MFGYLDLLLAMGFAWMMSGICLIILNRKSLISAKSAIFLISVFGLTILDNLLKPQILPDSVETIILIISRSSYFLIGPALLFYTQSILNQKSRREVKWLHYVPFLLMVIYRALNPHKLYPEYMTSDIPVESALDTLLDLLSLFSRILYCIVVLRRISRHEATVPEFYSNKTYRNTLSWFYYLVIIYLSIFLFNFIILLPSPSIHHIRMTTAILIRIVPALLFIFLYTLFSPNQPAIESHDEELNIRKSESKKKEKKYKSSNLSSRETRQIYEQLNTYIVRNSLHTDPDLTLKTLAEQMGETTHRLSETINSESGDNFYSYINAFRLNEFLTAVQENRYPNFTIHGIALECGFKSITAFYSNFKKEMGMTPKGFIKGLEKN